MSTTRRRVAIVLWVATFTLPAAAAYALWSATGTGGGAAHAVTAVDLQIAAGTAASDLYPGAAGVVAFAVTNPNPYPVTVTAGSVSSITGITGAAGTCTSSNFTLGTGSVASTTIAAGATSAVVLIGAITMKSTAGDGCQGAVVAVSATLTGSQS